MATTQIDENIWIETKSYGSNAIKNRIRFGGSLGTNQYFYVTNAKTGTIEINRYEKETKTGKVTETKIGKIPQGGKFIPNTNASSAEKTHYNSPREVGKARAQALQVARREWDGRTQPPPTQAIYGTDSGNIGYTPSGSSTADTSIRGTQTTGYSSDNPSSSASGLPIARANNISNSLRGINNIANRGFNNRLSSGGGGDAVVYPTTLRRSGNAQDYIRIDQLKWEPKKREGYSWKGNRKASADSRVQRRVILPIPGGISDSNTVSWGGDKMDPAQSAMANLALAGIEEGVEGMGGELNKIGEQIKTNKKEVKDAISKGIAGMASGTGAQLLTRTTGQVLNPNMELLFKDPSLRPFTFTCKLASRSSE